MLFENCKELRDKRILDAGVPVKKMARWDTVLSVDGTVCLSVIWRASASDQFI